MKVLAVASEIYPLVKTGGLADVVGALPAALHTHDVAVTTMVPGYPAVLNASEEWAIVATLPSFFGGRTTIKRATVGGLDLFALDAPHLFDRPGGPYGDLRGQDWPDNPQRYGALSSAAAELCTGLVHDYLPDIVHVHDWQAAMTLAYLHYSGLPRPKSVITVHNLAFQGQYPPTILGSLALPQRAFALEGIEYYGMIGFLKAGLYFADRITTVSPRYASEIKTAEAGMGLEGLLAGRAASLSGIVNGIDSQEWNPAVDPKLAANFSTGTLGPRARNREALEKRFGIDHDASPLFCLVSRLTWQKGIDIMLEALPHLVESGARLVLLGSGDREMEAAFRQAADLYPGRVGVVIGYDEALSHLMFGGADMTLVPSRFEPCGLTQLYGLRYGCVPVVARVGGLSDTLVDANDAALTLDAATGVQFHPVNAPMLQDAITRAIALYRDKPVWRAMQKRGMQLDLSWTSRAGAYARLYRELLA
ncbi:glycogen synthase GlgA [Labrys monachus]|uniref:glycogen synthase GlgA n=1 Tax=Labrys monachus TaxID=217067 RepID=UPI0027D8B11D|nr:glycogen synthase GlgA [Labrys monachus]